ncbi:hypothetical protein FA95DRAFT_1221128 [Auriscalpium vulgare]|uniref:Uncharacterized protein n=1 Tax=Auriscalpium vulgare TaxID=40419 RepID=A0ACB8R3C8_9AGAM|nr:hypothetical protein FA95DRAFT_1221128 [Auriscalpium vulgare]
MLWSPVTMARNSKEKEAARAISLFSGAFRSICSPGSPQPRRVSLIVTGYLWMLASPSPQLGGSETYIDENALQPAQVNTYYWSWGGVRRCGRLPRRTGGPTRPERATRKAREAVSSSISSSSGLQARKVSRGVNAYAIYSPPRASGTEATVISALWLSQIDGRNLRGLSTVVALSALLTRYSHWSKNLV